MIRLLLLFLVLSIPLYSLAFGYYSPKYTESAHGSNTYGVKRTGLSPPPEYIKGQCAHCHEPHTSSGGSEPVPPDGPYQFGLFAPLNQTSQNDNFCFQCHKGAGSLQADEFTNNTYSANFGGGTVTFSNIYDAFNPPSGSTPSSHNLSDVLTHAVSRNIGFTSVDNACVVCHDPHRSEKNYPVTPTGTGGVNTAVRRPLDYQGNPYNLWGDENAVASGFNELMSDFTNKYQAPYFKGGAPNNYEPANNNTSDGSNLPNFVNACLNNCHGTNNVYSTTRGRNLLKIDWSTTGDDHGRKHDSGGLGTTIAPYGDSSFNYVLSCTDCHEPHGSQNEWLLRTCVNGTDNISVPAADQWWNVCFSCHTVPQHTAPWNPTTDCFNNGICHEHGGAFF